MKFSLRDLIWLTLAVSLLILLLLEHRHRIAAEHEAKNRGIENDYLTARTLKLEEQLHGSAVRPLNRAP
ncbi:hypothetical protein ETAA8_27600 [Anatilimnocola aggregata]|uniref:Uncharacterized protein n=1 Tax=Anatilimnocola aggregata TaxID=2528021 RepID=A0A517YBT2_9BACT|nr:hypothetical protein [Anatilimnocola aggregata]QDU27671.1 hypothetical protein ETAA8_27600 [Anatilimnocola aggregata]